MSTSLEKLLALVNSLNTCDFSLADLSFGVASANTLASIARNTKVDVLATNTGVAKGRMSFYYDRLDLGTVFQGLSVQVTAVPGTKITAAGLAELLRARYGVELYAEDVVEGGEFLLDTLPYTIKLYAKEDSYCWTGELSVTLVEEQLDISTELKVTKLSGLNLPNHDITRSQGRVYSWDFKVPAPKLAFAKALQVGRVADPDLLNFINGIPLQPWVLSDSITNNNLTGARVVYNGSTGTEIADAYPGNPLNANILVIELGPLCKNVGGYLLFGY